MKKFFLSVLVICIIIMLPIIANADMGAPEINPYDATPRSVDGAIYYELKYDESYERYEEAGKIEYGDTVRIFYETNKDGVKYGEFETHDENNYKYYQVKLSDMHIANDDMNVVYGKTDSTLLSLSDNLEIYKGPAYIYDVVGRIPMQEQFVGRRQASIDSEGNIFEDTMMPWFYVEYDGVTGWVCELNSAIGSYEDNEIIMMRDLILEDGTVVIPASTVINGYYETDAWSQKAFVPYGDSNYFVSFYDCGIKANDGDWYKSLGKISYDGAKLYRMASMNSEVLVDNIPNGTELEIKYIEWDLRWIGWAYAEYDGVEGWFIVFESDDAREQFLAGDESLNSKEKSTVTAVNNSEETEKKEEDIEVVKQKEKPQEEISVSSKSDDIVIPSIILYIGIAVIIALTSCVIILLINKKKE